MNVTIKDINSIFGNFKIHILIYWLYTIVNGMFWCSLVLINAIINMVLMAYEKQQKKVDIWICFDQKNKFTLFVFIFYFPYFLILFVLLQVNLCNATGGLTGKKAWNRIQFQQRQFSVHLTGNGPRAMNVVLNILRGSDGVPDRAKSSQWEAVEVNIRDPEVTRPVPDPM